ncbi:MAG: hypothetical protein HC916_11300 [Coleofasciculaceae cyanobacterium SM2_1_6]|nr:hypothetical protein [Coleofasciculaceae cyanobacterium SM2_1_6]
MVNFGLNSASILGIFLAVGGAGLYFLRSFRPELSRDHDIFFAAIGLLCGFILIFQGWRLDPILQFGQFLLAASVVFFAVETIRLRGATTEQAKRASPRGSSDDDYRPVTKAYTYTAELDELEAVDDYPDSRRLRGTTRRGDDYDPEPPRRRLCPLDRPPQKRRSRRPSSSTPSRPGRVSDDDWDAPPPRPATNWSDELSRADGQRSSKRSPSRGSSPSRRPRPESSDDYANSTWQEEIPEPRSRRSRPQPPEDFAAPEDLPPRTRASREVPPPEDYVDFQPIDTPAPEDEEQPRGSEY